MVLASCVHTENFKQANAVSSPNSSGGIDVYELGEPFDKEHTLIGTLWLGESGNSVNYGYEEALNIARKKNEGAWCRRDTCN